MSNSPAPFRGTMRKRLRAFFWLLAAVVALMMAILLVTQFLLQRDTLHLQEHFLPHWQSAQQLSADAQALNALAARLPLAATPAELESTRELIDRRFGLLDAGLVRISGFVGDNERRAVLEQALRDLRRGVAAAEAAARERLALPQAEPPAAEFLRAFHELRRRERDLAVAVDQDALRLASHAGVLAADADHRLLLQREEYRRKLWLQTLIIVLTGLVGGALLWGQYRVLDRHLLQRIDALRTAMAHGATDARLLGAGGHDDEFAAMQVELARLLERLTRQNEALEQLAITDDLTGLANRRHLFEQLHKEIRRSRRYAKPMSIVLIDIDHFKRVNDTWGHSVGDRVLREAARVHRMASRSTDLVARYGGEEFALLLPETGLEGARTVAEGLRRRVAEAAMPVPDGNDARITISVGVATLRAGETADELMRRADAALYVAKNGGRNRIELADP